MELEETKTYNNNIKLIEYLIYEPFNVKFSPLLLILIKDAQVCYLQLQNKIRYMSIILYFSCIFLITRPNNY